MKRRVEEPTKVDGVAPAILAQRAPHGASAIVQGNYSTQGIKAEVTSLPQYYATMPSITTAIKSQSSCGLQGGAPPHGGILVQSHIRHTKVTSSGATGGGATPPTVTSTSGGGPQQQFQRLKVEDALSYLDQVKYKFNSQPQVYNDFLEIMKEFKSQCIDTPGVITRVSQLFKGYPELISGFNTFLPPGYKIEVQANDTGYSLQVSVSNPLGLHTISDIPPLTPTQPTSVVVTNQQKPPTAFSSVNSLNSTASTTASSVTIKSNVNDRINPSVIPMTSSAVQGAAVALSSVSSSISGLVAMQNSGNVSASNHQPSLIAAVQAQAASASQPVEFNHAINYVNKIKNRFQGQPEKYKKFLEILHTYQKEQKTAKSGTGLPSKLTEAEVYSQVAQLFENHEDLLLEFGQFLPDATSHNSLSLASLGVKLNERKSTMNSKYQSGGSNRGESRMSAGEPMTNSKSSPQGSLCKTMGGRDSMSNKRSIADVYGNDRITLSRAADSTIRPQSPMQHHGPPPPPPTKRQKSHQLVYMNSGDSLEPIKRAIRNQSVYENFLRCLLLFNDEVISKSELLTLVAPMLVKHPDQFNWFKDLLGEINPPPPNSPPLPTSSSHPSHYHSQPLHHSNSIPQLPLSQMPLHQSSAYEHRSVNLRDSRSDLLSTASPADIDFTSCKRIGASYCALPKSVPPPRCSGRSMLCKQVLNDMWVSFPTWSEDSTFITSRKTQYEEYIYRCEDERFELDLVIECNASTIRVLEAIQKKMARMSPDELTKFRLDDTLGGTSPTIHLRALRRLYGDKAPDVIDGLKRNPSVVVPVVLRRLKCKEFEWRQAQKGFNKTWRDQNEKFYLKSLDHQGINFKQNDLKTLRSKSLYNEIEVLYDERNENGESERTGPHLVLNYTDKSVLDDAANLLIHHVKRQTPIHKQDKTRIKQLLKQILPDMFHHARQEMSDDEQDEKMDTDQNDKESNEAVENNIEKSKDLSSDENANEGKLKETAKNEASPSSNFNSCEEMEEVKTETEDEDKEGVVLENKHAPHLPDEIYTLFYGNNHWYLFIRLHQILCERLSKMSERSAKIAEEEAANSINRRESTAVALRLKPNEQFEDCYGAMLDMVKSVLDCSMDPQTYEDTLRNMFGIHAYIGFTLDRIVSYAVRQLQHLVSDDSCVECTELHIKYKNKGTGGLCSTANSRANAEAAYFKAVSTSLNGDSCFKMNFYQKESKVTIEMLDTEGDEEEESGGGRSETAESSHKADNPEKWNDFKKADSGVSLANDDRNNWSKAVYLLRNLNRRKWRDNKPDDGIKDGEKCISLENKGRKLYISLKDSYLVHNGALARARKTHCNLSRRMYSRFSTWHSEWARCNVEYEANERVENWFHGRSSVNMHPCRTIPVTHDPGDKKAPYRPYTRYTVRYFRTDNDRSPNSNDSS